MASSYASKLALFRARFGCRADAWAKRWTSRGTGRSGFAPACGNEWRPGFCLKPSKRCSACHHRAWLPLTDEIVRWHLLGATPSGRPFALGGYPILIGDDARVAALQVPATAHPRGSPDLRREIQNAGEVAEQGPLRSLREIQNAAAAMGIPPTITSAVDGDGVVLWWFFSAPFQAGLARSLVSACLTSARRAGADVPFSAWDGILPEQATLPVTGPGVPVPLPLQGEARRRGLGVPLDPATLAPAPDPWAALSAAPVLDPPRVERIVESARGRLYPVASVDREQCIMRDAPAETESSTRHSSLVTRRSRVSGTLSDRLRIPLAELPSGAAAALEETAAFLSPVFEDAERTRRPVRGIPRIESHSRIEAMPIDRKAAVRRKVADWARDVSAEAMPGVVGSVLAAQIADGTIVPADEAQRDAIQRDATTDTSTSVRIRAAARAASRTRRRGRNTPSTARHTGLVSPSRENLGTAERTIRTNARTSTESNQPSVKTPASSTRSGSEMVRGSRSASAFSARRTEGRTSRSSSGLTTAEMLARTYLP